MGFLSPRKTSAFFLFLFALPLGACSQENLGEELKNAKEKTSEAASALYHTINDQAKVLFDQAGALSAVKEEISRVYKSATDYDVVISAEGSDEEGIREHQARIEAMDHIQIGALTVGYEELSERSLGGTVFARHFRATWISHGQKIGLSYYSRQEIDAKAFIELLMRVVPVIESYIK